MSKQNIHSRQDFKGFRQQLRQNLTPAEAFLWNQLKSKKLEGKRFTKQHSIGQYIVDFYCASEKLVIELDGEIHNNPDAQDYDLIRTKLLSALGYKVIRFENRMVFENLSSVLKEIKDNFKN